MEAIPLLCKVCPKEPHFSDISHLLTHVDSKGHLKYHSTAKIRAREDQAIRQRLDEFNEWYEKHGIERLLSQRILQKDRRNNNARLKASTDKEAKPPKIPRRTRKKQLVLPNTPNGPDVKEHIDPRLSQSQDSNWLMYSAEEDMMSQSPPPFDITSLHRGRVPSMRSWTPTGDPPQLLLHRSRQQVGDRVIKSDTDVEEATDWMESPEHPTYPDPSTLPGSFPFMDPSTPTSTPKKHDGSTASSSHPGEHTRRASEKSTNHMVKLKGPQWPGMALFDSASPKAQRLRNQKKEHSTLQQMEHSSNNVKPLERIFFPEWTLKIERTITGNVESSPLIEPTPKPKRRKPRPSRAILADLSTNAPKRRVRKALKRATPEQVDNAMDIVDPFVEKPLDMKSSSSCTTEKSEALPGVAAYQDRTEWLLNNGLPNFENQRSFNVYRDPTNINHGKPTYHFPGRSATTEYPFLRLSLAQSGNHHQGMPNTNLGGLSQGQCTLTRKAPARATTSENNRHGVWDQSLRASRTIGIGKENIEPLMHPSGGIDYEAPRAGAHRVTQRYFSVSGNESPRFFDTMPPEMEFGGRTDHHLLGSSFNPLNPQLLRQRSQLQGVETYFGTPLSMYGDSRIKSSMTPKNEDLALNGYTADSGLGNDSTWADL